MKAMAFLVKLPQLSDAAFSAHWRHPHGTMTRRIPQFRRYVQNHRIGNVPGLREGDWSGVPAIWLDDVTALTEAQAHPDYAPLDADGDNMYVRDRTLWLIGYDTVVADPLPGAGTMPIKVMLLLGDGTVEIPRWSATDLCSALATVLPEVVGASVTVPLDPAAPSACAAVIELSFPDQATFEASWADGSTVLPLVGAVADLRSSHGILAREERVIWPDLAREH